MAAFNLTQTAQQIQSDLDLTEHLQGAFSSSSTYAVNDIVIHNSRLYRCHTAVASSGEWTGATNWSEIQLKDLIATGPVGEHLSNTTIHVTQSDKNSWDGKTVVSASVSGTSQTPIAYITIDGVEYAIASQIPGTVYWNGVVGLRQNLIEKVNAAPTPNADTSDFVQTPNGKIYIKKVQTASISNLTNTTWIIADSGLQSISGGATFNINFTSNSTNYTSMVFSSPYISWSLKYDDTQVYGGLPVVWTNSAYRTITITGGTDATNAQLIDWLVNNAELQGAVYNYSEINTNKYYMHKVYLKLTAAFRDTSFVDGTQSSSAGSVTYVAARWITKDSNAYTSLNDLDANKEHFVSADQMRYSYNSETNNFSYSNSLANVLVREDGKYVEICFMNYSNKTMCEYTGNQPTFMKDEVTEL